MGRFLDRDLVQRAEMLQFPLNHLELPQWLRILPRTFFKSTALLQPVSQQDAAPPPGSYILARACAMHCRH